MRIAAALICLAGTARADRPAAIDPSALPSGSASRSASGALDELPLAGEAALAIDVEHADASDGVAVVPGLRLAFGDRGFLALALPAGWQHQLGGTILGNATATLGAAGPTGAVAVRFGAPTAPSLGDPARIATALALPRVADPELFLPATTSLELLADRRWERPTTWLQLEGGAMVRWTDAAEAVARVSVAGGVAVERWLDLSASFVTRVTFHPGTEHFVHSLVLGAIVHAPAGQIAVRIDVPIDNSARRENRFVAGLALTY